MSVDPDAERLRRIVEAALAATYAFGPPPWPSIVTDVIDQIVARLLVVAGREGVKSEMAGAYQVTYESAAAGIVLTPLEEAALSPWSLPRAGTVEVLSEASYVEGDLVEVYEP